MPCFWKYGTMPFVFLVHFFLVSTVSKMPVSYKKSIKVTPVEALCILCLIRVAATLHINDIKQNPSRFSTWSILKCFIFNSTTVSVSQSCGGGDVRSVRQMDLNNCVWTAEDLRKKRAVMSPSHSSLWLKQQQSQDIRCRWRKRRGEVRSGAFQLW